MLWPFIAALNPFRSAQCVPDSSDSLHLSEVSEDTVGEGNDAE